jgi:HTH-type transcriptional regulator/antitoxin HigA
MASAIRPVGPSYFKLLRAFPLSNLRTDAELDAAVAVVDALMRRELDEGEADYLDALADIIEKYETAAHPIRAATPADVLRLLMEANGLNQSQLGAQVGIAQSTLSAVLNGKRTLRTEHMVKLATCFNVSPPVFLPQRDSAPDDSQVDGPPRNPANARRNGAGESSERLPVIRSPVGNMRAGKPARSG